MSETVHLFLKTEKQGDIKGESTMESLGRKDSIECVYYDHSVTTAREASTGTLTGRRQHHPILIRKRIDKASPLLHQALVSNEKVKEATFKFFRPNPKGDGTTEQFYSVIIKNGAIGSVKQYSPDALNPETTNYPPLEEVTFVFQDIEWRNESGKTSASDSWKDNK